MVTIHWDDSLGIGHDLIDKQHQEMFRRADLLLEASDKGSDLVTIKETMQFLVRYVEEHFQDELQLMQQAEYPAWVQHSFEHDKLTKSLHLLVADFINNPTHAELPRRLCKLVVSWMSEHIKKSDVAFCEYVKNRADRKGPPPIEKN